MENVGAIPFLDYKHFATQVFFPKVQQSPKDSQCSYLTKIISNIKLAFILMFQNESLLTLCMRDIGQVRFDTSATDVGAACSLSLCHWSSVVSHLKSGCDAGSAQQLLPGLVQAGPGPALPHFYGARSGGAEELQYQWQVHRFCSICFSFTARLLCCSSLRPLWVYAVFFIFILLWVY